LPAQRTKGRAPRPKSDFLSIKRYHLAMYLHSRVHVQKMSPEGANMNSPRWSEAEPGVGSKRMRGPRRGPTKTSNRERRPHRVRFCTERGLPSRSVISHDESGDTIPITATVTLNRGTQYRLLLLSHCRPYFHPSLDLCPAFPDALSGLRGPNGLVTQGFALGYIPPDPSGRMAPGRVRLTPPGRVRLTQYTYP
jgi:hypothetical protein